MKKDKEKGKNLDVAVTRIEGLSIDLVNLRHEEYTAESSTGNDETKFGTPKMDASRRDLTLNALFYNINEDKIEDYTGTGVEDLKKRICRTPIDAIITLLDDPIRPLRNIRFANKYGFSIDSQILEAVKT